MINRLSSILAALALALLARAAQAQWPAPPQPQPQPQTKPQSQPPAKPRQESQGGFLYKSTMPDGKVIYGDAPEEGAVKVDKTRPDTSKKGITASTPKEAEALRRMEAERKARSSAVDPQPAGSFGSQPAFGSQPGVPFGATEAQLETRLRELEADREKAKEPLPGERIGTAGGGSRFTDDYWERQKRLDQNLDAVRRELERSRSAK
jgi:hypothetical protein